MTQKLSVLGIGLVVLILGVIGGGCGEAVHESSSYYYPNWMPDGRIICWKVTSRWSSALWGRKELGDTNYITAMDADGNNETNLFEISGSAKEVTCSPTGEMIAFIDHTASTRDIVITNYAGDVVYNPGVTGTEYLDWSPDATKIVYSNSSKELHVVNRDGNGDAKIYTNAYHVAWRLGSRIVFEGTTEVRAIYQNGAGMSDVVSSGALPQLTDITTLIYMDSLGDIHSVKLDGTLDVPLFNNYELASLKLSFDNTKTVGGDLITGGGSRIGGIWVTDISDGTSTKIR